MVKEDDQLVPWRTRLLARLITSLVFVLRRTWRVRFHDRELLDEAKQGGAVVLACWHGELATMVPLHDPTNVVGLTSLSADGGLAAGVLQHLGYGVIRGSSSRGGASAYLALANALENGTSTAIAVDGPRGPHHFVHWGVTRLSLETGCPIVFAVSRCKPAIALPTWDRFAIPLPFATVELQYGRLTPGKGMEADTLALELHERMEALETQFSPVFSGHLLDDSVVP